MLRTLSTIAAMAAVALAAAQTDIYLYPEGQEPDATGREAVTDKGQDKGYGRPFIRIYPAPADKATGRAVVACPGGGYAHLAWNHEGYDWAPFFNELGFAYIVLKYRMPHQVTEVPISDAKEALRVVREHAKEWNIDPKQVGIMGSSAGGHLASTIATHSTAETAPAFQVLFYPVISMQPGVTHQGSHDALLGRNAAQQTNDLYSNALQVNSQTPPAIMLLSDDDGAVPPQNSAEYYLALKKAGVKAAIYVYPSGGHGWGIRSNFKYHDNMMNDLKEWLKTL